MPLFYDRPDGLPRGWIAKIKHNWARSARPSPPAAWSATTPRATTRPPRRPHGGWPADEFAASRKLWKRRAAAAWPGVSGAPGRRTGIKERQLGARFTVQASVRSGRPRPQRSEVQVAYGRVDDADDSPETSATLKQNGQRTPDGWAFEGEVPLATQGAFGYTVRVVPRHALATPSELGLVAWA